MVSKVVIHVHFFPAHQDAPSVPAMLCITDTTTVVDPHQHIASYAAMPSHKRFPSPTDIHHISRHTQSASVEQTSRRRH